MKKIIVLGTGGHAKSIADSIVSGGEYDLIGFVSKDTKESPFVYGDRSIVGCDDDLERLFAEGIKYAAIGVGYLGKDNVREHLYKKLKEIGFVLPIIIDRSAIIGHASEIGEGSFIGKHAIVNANAVVGNMCIVNSGAVIEHDCVIGDFSHIACGAVLCGGVNAGEACLIGAGATVIEDIYVPKSTIVPAGETITRRNRLWLM